MKYQNMHCCMLYADAICSQNNVKSRPFSFLSGTHQEPQPIAILQTQIVDSGPSTICWCQCDIRIHSLSCLMCTGEETIWPRLKVHNAQKWLVVSVSMYVY